jgi:hypothetical protein
MNATLKAYVEGNTEQLLNAAIVAADNGEIVWGEEEEKTYISARATYEGLTGEYEEALTEMNDTTEKKAAAWDVYWKMNAASSLWNGLADIRSECSIHEELSKSK